ncbi:hypothetical protein RclHR1_06920002 [Rhizophagus clarus]|uniref:Uncharacterized protein n=1 Tax=Rhizophagus clarus TaxID=94130 RepID=A0A2Z6S0E1_9GLOM|nr:hypothetical protein RclHR1_06920002 [Rhizophagus clarus]
MGCDVFVVDSLYHEDRFRGDELSRKETIPLQNGRHTCRQNQDGDEQDKPSLNCKFDELREKKGDSAIYVRNFSPERYSNKRSKDQKQRVNSNEKNGCGTSVPMVPSECSERIRGMSLSLGELRRVDTLEGIVWVKKKPETPCHFVLPYNQHTTKKNNISTSVCQVSANKESDEIFGYRFSHAMVVDTIVESRRFSIATSLGFEIEKKGQDDFIGYIKEDLVGYIEEVREYGFEHIIVIGGFYLGIVFMDWTVCPMCYGFMVIT